MYKKTELDSFVIVLEGHPLLAPGTVVGETSPHWKEYQAWIAEGNKPESQGVRELTIEERVFQLERQVTARNLRGAALGDQWAIDHIQSIETKIAEMRGQE